MTTTYTLGASDRAPTPPSRTAAGLVDAPTDPDVVAERISQRELSHSPRLISDRCNRQPRRGHARVPVLGVAHDQIAARAISLRVDRHHVEVEHALPVEVHEREAARAAVLVLVDP